MTDSIAKKWLEVRNRLKAPKGRFKLVELDKNALPFEADTTIGIYNDLQNALLVRKWLTDNKSGEGLEYLIYNDNGFVVK